MLLEYLSFDELAIEEWREGWERKMDNAIGAYELSQFEKQMAREERKLPSEKEIGPEDLGLHFLVAHPDRPERRECEWAGADVRHGQRRPRAPPRVRVRLRLSTTAPAPALALAVSRGRWHRRWRRRW